MTDLQFARQPWIDRAACNGLNPDLFVPEKGQTSGPARRVCAVCPVAAECLDMALEQNLQFGIFGGMSARERRRERRVRGLAPPPPPRPERCSNNHELTDETCTVSFHGGWRCKVCDRAYQRRARERRLLVEQAGENAYLERRSLRIVQGGKWGPPGAQSDTPPWEQTS